MACGAVEIKDSHSPCSLTTTSRANLKREFRCRLLAILRWERTTRTVPLVSMMPCWERLAFHACQSRRRSPWLMNVMVKCRPSIFTVRRTAVQQRGAMARMSHLSPPPKPRSMIFMKELCNSAVGVKESQDRDHIMVPTITRLTSAILTGTNCKQSATRRIDRRS